MNSLHPLVSQPPFYSRNIDEMYDRILHDRIRFPDLVPEKARSFLSGLLIRIPEKRLGGGERDADDVKEHPFFGNIDWDKLYRRELVPPWSPGVEDALDLQHFDPEFVNEPVPQSVAGGGQRLVCSPVAMRTRGSALFCGVYSLTL